MQKFDIKGMSCAACVARVEKAVKDIDGVTEVSVNLLTNSMILDGDYLVDDVILSVKKAGYDAAPSQNTNKASQKAVKNAESEEHTLISRLISSLCILIVLMYFSMGHSMWGFPVPAFFEENFIAQGILQLVLSAIVMVINQRFFVSGFKSLFNKSPNMDTLVALGSSAAFVYSLYALFLMTWDFNNAHHYMHELYFESAAMILTLITVGKTLESHSKGKTTNAINALMNLSPKVATLKTAEGEKTIRADELKVGDIFIVRPGESIPCDGVVIYGETSVDESFLTGESIPVDKKINDKVSAGCINKYGYIECRATDVGEDTTLSKIIQIVSDAAAQKAPIAKIADRVSGVFVPIVILISVLTFIVWQILDGNIGFSLQRAISVLVISCPCALGLATPAAIMVGSGIGAKNGILFKNATSLEMTGKAQIVAFDKTGTLTKGTPEITDIVPFGDNDPELLLKYAYSLEKLSEHPLSKPIVKEWEKSNQEGYMVEDFEILSGKGLRGRIEGKEIVGGKLDLIEKIVSPDDNVMKVYNELSLHGKTPLMFAYDNEFLGIIAVSDTVKDDTSNALKMLKDEGLKVVMITGDNHNSASFIADKIGIDKVYSNVLPSEKENIIKELKTEGKVIMVGDGINDAPALTTADIGIAIGTGTDVAIDSADVILTKSTPKDVANAIFISRKVIKNIKENLFWAFFYNSIGIPVAMGLLIPFGITLNPMLGALAMSLSSFCVVSNALRLNLIKINKKQKENETMKIVLNIEGMMCPHCEKNVKDTLEAIDGVVEAVTSHKEGTAVITLSKEIDTEILKEAVRQKGYAVK